MRLAHDLHRGPDAAAGLSTYIDFCGGRYRVHSPRDPRYDRGTVYGRLPSRSGRFLDDPQYSGVDTE